MQFIGTAAAGGCVNPFCDCERCREARAAGMPSRFRTAFLLDEENLIDFGPDLFSACLALNRPLTKLRRAFITHTHEDHFDLASLLGITANKVPALEQPFEIYLSDSGYKALMQALECYRVSHFSEFLIKKIDRGMVKFFPLTPYKTYDIGGMKVMPVEAVHPVSPEEMGINYFFEMPDGTKLLYALDTNLYTERTFEALAGKQADILVMEASRGIHKAENVHHLSIGLFREMLREMDRREIIRPDAPVYATHRAHSCDVPAEEHERLLNEGTAHRVVLARDGMMVD